MREVSGLLMGERIMAFVADTGDEYPFTDERGREIARRRAEAADRRVLVKPGGR